MHLLRLTFLACLLAAVAVSAARAERRIALVIGNSAYKTVAPLANPKNDAELMAEALRDVGFEVVTAIDADRRTMAARCASSARRCARRATTRWGCSTSRVTGSRRVASTIWCPSMR